jgi:hypothetical protein
MPDIRQQVNTLLAGLRVGAVGARGARRRSRAVMRGCAILTAGAVTGLILLAATAYVVLMNGPDTSLSF